MAEVQEQKKSGSKKGLIIAFVIILLAINGVQLFLNIQKSNDIEEKDLKISDQQTRIDSISVELDAAIKDLEVKKQQLADLGADTTKLGEQIRGLIAERDNLAKQNRANYNKYLAIKKEIDNAKRIAAEAEEKIVKLEATIADQHKIIQETKQKVASLTDTLSLIDQEKQKLAEKVALASVLKAENFNVVALSTKGKPKEGEEFKSKQIDKLRVSFQLADNKVAEKGSKEIIFRLIEPDGSALFDLSTGGGTFFYNDKEVYYTLKQNILFDNKNQKVGFEYRKGTPYKPGKHTIEIYAEGAKIGESNFVVK